MEKEIDYRAIAEEINQMALADQGMRQRAETEDDFWDYEVDRRNTARLKEIVTEIGWPTIALFGQDVSRAAWIVIQHADKDIDFQEHCLALMESSPEGEVDKHDIAYLTDRIRKNRKLSQVYGTQFVLDKATGKYIPAPIENPEGVEERRRSMGLNSLADNIAKINER